MFKRRSTTLEAETPTPTSGGLSGKGRPTPSRKTAEAARAARVKPPKDSREARKIERQRAMAERVAARKGLAAGDPKYLPARDRGPARLWIRNYVDARWSPGELILPGAFIAFLLGLVTPLALYFFYLLLLGVVFDAVVLSRRIGAGLRENFPDEPTRGLRKYGILRASLIRRMRVPKPVVPRPVFGRSKKSD